MPAVYRLLVKHNRLLRSALGSVSVVVLDGVLLEHNSSFILVVVLGKFSMHQVAQIDSI